MRQSDHCIYRYGFGRFAATGLVVVGFCLAALGTGCDSDAQADFRQEATASIGEGVKTIVDAIIDGYVAAIVNAGDGSSSDDDSSSSS